MRPDPPGAWATPVLDVSVTSGTQTNCSGIARATADFEPAREFSFERRLDPGYYVPDDPELVDACCRWVEEGVRAELRDRTGGSLPPVRVVLRTVLVHEVDSNEARNTEAGRLLVARAAAQRG